MLIKKTCINDLRIIVDVDCEFHKDYFTFYNRDWNWNSETNFCITCGKYFIKIIFDTKIEIGVFENISCAKFQ